MGSSGQTVERRRHERSRGLFVVAADLRCLRDEWWWWKARKGKPLKRWHVADTEDQCGQTTQLNTFKDARPASLCSNSQTSPARKFCVCVTRDDPANSNAVWKFKCGLCELRWKPSFNEADRLRKKNIQQQRKKARFERMRKTRRKLKKEQKRKQKKQNRKG